MSTSCYPLLSPSRIQSQPGNLVIKAWRYYIDRLAKCVCNHHIPITEYIQTNCITVHINDGIVRNILVSYLPFWHIQKRQVKDFRVSNLCIWFLGYVDNLKIYFVRFMKATLIFWLNRQYLVRPKLCIEHLLPTALTTQAT